MKQVSCSSEEEYAAKADNFLGGWVYENTYECIRQRNDTRLLYNVDSREFGFVNKDGFITSYYTTKRYKTLEAALAYMERACQ